ncbi:MAG: CdaR family protein [Roseiflexus sp.]|nr:CdaR family protein [Roseiflexus sp.]MCS7291144.1 CdaR family protein [Roseiflexus sp.]MDW8147772.1 CdaR family protein [Roseiflexaceae bacterium]MDW8232449.1 CdaR family protein [Roseiflexaceae bacterium]
MDFLNTSALRFLLALILAFTLWVFVSYTQNPELSTAYDNVPVDIEGLAPGLIVVDQEGLPRSQRPEVDITVLTDAETLRERDVRLSDLRPFVDLTGRGPGEHTVPVNVVTTRSLRLRTTVEPNYLVIRLDQEITKTVALTVETTGAVPFGFEARAPQVTSRKQPLTSVTVRGPQSRVARVAAVRARVDIDRLTANYNSPRTLEPVDANGQPVAGVTVEPATADVLVPIIPSVGLKRVPVVPSITGFPASGYMVTEVEVSPLLVTLTGSSGPLDNAENVPTADVDITGATQTFTRSAPLIAPQGTQLRFGEPTEAIVTVRIAPINRPFQVTVPALVQVVGISDGLLASLSPNVVSVTVAGAARQLEALSSAQLLGVVNVRGLGPGTHELEPTFTLPEGVTLAAPTPRVFVTLRLLPTVTPMPTSTSESTAQPTASPGTPGPTPTSGPTQTHGETPIPTGTP